LCLALICPTGKSVGSERGRYWRTWSALASNPGGINLQAATDFARRANQVTDFARATSSRAPKRARKSLRVTANFVSRFRLIRAAGSSARKISIYENQKLCKMCASRSHQEGRFAVVTDVGSGMRWTRLCLWTNGATRGRRNRVVLISRRWDQVSQMSCEATVAIKPGTPGRARDKPKTIAQGRPECFGEPVVLLVCFLPLHTRLRVRKTPGFPCALRFRGHILDAQLGQIMPRDYGCSSWICRVGKATASAVAPRTKARACPSSPCVVDTVGTAQARLCPPYVTGCWIARGDDDVLSKKANLIHSRIRFPLLQNPLWCPTGPVGGDDGSSIEIKGLTTD
jgi:hypothetical protein